MQTGKCVFQLAAAGDFGVAVGAQRVQTEIDPSDSRIGKCLRLTRQQQTVCGQGDLFNARNLAQHTGERRQIVTAQRFAAGQLDLPQSELCQRTHDLGDLLKA